MTVAFDRALAQTLGFEGGHANNPLDRGGPTKWGVTQATYDAWRATTGQAKRSVDDMEESEMRTIYFDDYWKPCACELLPATLAPAVFDMAVNSGIWNAKVTLQQALSVRRDGVIGPVTLAVANGTPDALLRFLKKRGAFLQDDLSERPADVAFLEGWINRLLDQAWMGGHA